MHFSVLAEELKMNLKAVGKGWVFITVSLTVSETLMLLPRETSMEEDCAWPQLEEEEERKV